MFNVYVDNKQCISGIAMPFIQQFKPAANPVQASNTFIVTPNMLTAHEALWRKR